jgi:hypothetical protein
MLFVSASDLLECQSPGSKFRTLKHAFVCFSLGPTGVSEPRLQVPDSETCSCFSLGPTGLPEPGLQVPDSAGGVPEPEKGVAVHHGLRLGGAQRLKEQLPARSESIFSQLKGQCHEIFFFGRSKHFNQYFLYTLFTTLYNY